MIGIGGVLGMELIDMARLPGLHCSLVWQVAQ
jgi:hypothetical protein